MTLKYLGVHRCIVGYIYVNRVEKRRRILYRQTQGVRLCKWQKLVSLACKGVFFMLDVILVIQRNGKGFLKTVFNQLQLVFYW